MKDKMLHEKDTFLKEAIRKVTPENPGNDFMHVVMSRVANETPHRVVLLRKEPLIPVKVKVAFTFIFSALLVTVFVSAEKNNTLALYVVQMEEFISRYMSLFVSRLFVLSSLACAALFILQVYVLSKRMKFAG